MANENSNTGAGEASNTDSANVRADSQDNHVGEQIRFVVEGKTIEGTFEGYEESENIETKSLRVKTEGTEDDVVVVGVNSDAIVKLTDKQ